MFFMSYRLPRENMRILKPFAVAVALGALVAGAACRRKEAPAVTPSELIPPGETPEETPPGPATADEKTLLEIARKSLRLAVTEGARYEPPTPVSAELLEPRGAFVTLKHGGDLRGCIGYPLPNQPLYLAVRDNAINAALNDPRFAPVTAAELLSLDVEISVMTPLVEVKDPNEIVVGQDGLVIEAGGHSGLLLPQVAPEQGWDLQEYLDGLCMKAGLPPGAYRRRDAKLYKFQARVFGAPYVEK